MTFRIETEARGRFAVFTLSGRIEKPAMAVLRRLFELQTDRRAIVLDLKDVAVVDRDAESKGSINKKGHFQTDLMGLLVEVKDSTRNPDKWAYYGFEPDAKTAEAMPKVNCWSCHDQHAAVEHTFVQFYPTLKPVAKNFGTYNEVREKVEDVK
jgi:hypothetical protein